MKKIITLAVRTIPAIIMLQTLFFKFGFGGKEALELSQMLFGKISTTLFDSPKYEAYGRIGTGIIELIASILLLIPKTSWVGALLGVVVMTGAVISHVLILGVVMNDEDGGALFLMALIVLVCCLKVVYDNRERFLTLLK